MVELNPNCPLRVAIIGAGPGGLGAAIALSGLQNVQFTIYERAHELRAIGGGIRIGYNAWRVLELLGADSDVKGHVRMEVQYRYVVCAGSIQRVFSLFSLVSFSPFPSSLFRF
jgi:salicylate hydroxylase